MAQARQASNEDFSPESLSQEQVSVIQVLGQFESDNGRKVGMAPLELERETQKTWYQLVPVLNSLGHAGGLIEMHKGTGYTDYWLPVELEERSSGLYRQMYAHIWQFRLTEKGLACYQEIARTSESEGALGDDRPQARHSPDFRSVHWFGTEYYFTRTQAEVMKILWEAWENGTFDVGTAHLLEQSQAESKRLVDVFKDSEAWGKIVGKGNTQGSYRLIHPDHNS